MMRFRRYRIFAVVSFIVVFLFYKSSHPANWELNWSDPLPADSQYENQDQEKYRSSLNRGKTDEGEDKEIVLDDAETENTKDPPNLSPAEGLAQEVSTVIAAPPPVEETPAAKSSDAAAVEEEGVSLDNIATGQADDPPTVPEVRPGGQHEIQPPPGEDYAAATPSPIHWEPQPENFPLAPEEIIALPTAAAEAVPRIQFRFPPETEEGRSKREDRLGKVKAEMQHAWSGYEKYAWGHDELTPVSLAYKDPFCGWAATLVDSLDTLWIMGMKDEFDKAVDAVGRIDFTYSPYRQEIPVFETTIRYLGGLLGAYDVSGGTSTREAYGVLLDKAGELADILMGIFDTPNRMPLLYYNYHPESVAQPKLASSRAGVAELGSLLMEFTRLAQTSGKQKYYDAVARITNAFDDLGKRGTDLPGLFPELLDISGCNRTVEPKEEPKDITQQVIPGLNPSLSKDHDRHDSGDAATLYKGAAKDEYESTGESLRKRGEVSAVGSPLVSAGIGPVGSSRSPPSDILENCRPQPMVSAGFGSDSYSIGGSQDSTYEYFPKEYLLLGAREPQYKRLALGALEATKNNLLFRPMTPDERDILFSAKVVIRRLGNPDYLFETTHLTCFAGGMYAMAGRIFESEEYVDLGRRLTDGCVWAYESFPTGIMPENSRVVPCKNPESCPWSESVWHEWIDPNGGSKDKQQKDYDERKAVALEQERAQAQAARAKAKEVEPERTQEESAGYRQAQQFAGAIKAEAAHQAELDKHRAASSDGRNGDAGGTAAGSIEKESIVTKEATETLRKRTLAADSGVDTSHLQADDAKRAGIPKSQQGRSEGGSGESSADRGGGDGDEEDELSTPAPKTKEEAEALAANPPPIVEDGILEHNGHEPQRPLAPYDPETDPSRPLNHTQFVSKRIASEGLPPGFVAIPSREYILRPEAIESVWYMYRITGDTAWQDKGWRMFQSIIKATRTEAGHSAISDVTQELPVQKDSMESFWLAETLKYFYLLFAEPDVVSLDDWVLNTEAHPFKRPKA